VDLIAVHALLLVLLVDNSFFFALDEFVEGEIEYFLLGGSQLTELRVAVGPIDDVQLMFGVGGMVRHGF